MQKAFESDRIAACWFATDQFSIAVNLTEDPAQRSGLYFLDRDLLSRSLRVDVSDAHSGFLLDSREVFPSSDGITYFSGGAYFVWRLSGGVRFHLTRLAGPNAVVSGLFLDP